MPRGRGRRAPSTSARFSFCGEGLGSQRDGAEGPGLSLIPPRTRARPPAIGTRPPQSGTFVTVDEPTSTRRHHTQPTIHTRVPLGVGRVFGDVFAITASYRKASRL